MSDFDASAPSLSPPPPPFREGVSAPARPPRPWQGSDRTAPGTVLKSTADVPGPLSETTGLDIGIVLSPSRSASQCRHDCMTSSGGLALLRASALTSEWCSRRRVAPLFVLHFSIHFLCYVSGPEGLRPVTIRMV